MEPDRIARLVALVERLDRCRDSVTIDCADRLVRFNGEASPSLSLSLLEFHGLADGLSPQALVLGLLAPAPYVEDLTRADVGELLKRVREAKGTEWELAYWCDLLATNLPGFDPYADYLEVGRVLAQTSRRIEL